MNTPRTPAADALDEFEADDVAALNAYCENRRPGLNGFKVPELKMHLATLSDIKTNLMSKAGIIDEILAAEWAGQRDGNEQANLRRAARNEKRVLDNIGWIDAEDTIRNGERSALERLQKVVSQNPGDFRGVADAAADVSKAARKSRNWRFVARLIEQGSSPIDAFEDVAAELQDDILRGLTYGRTLSASTSVLSNLEDGLNREANVEFIRTFKSSW